MGYRNEDFFFLWTLKVLKQSDFILAQGYFYWALRHEQTALIMRAIDHSLTENIRFNLN